MASPHDHQVQRRGRHLKVAAFLNRRDIADTLLTLCIVLRPVTRLQMSLCKHDSPRKRPPTSRPEFAEPPRGHPIAPFRPEARAALATVSSLPATVSRPSLSATVSGQSSLATVSLRNVLEELAAAEADNVVGIGGATPGAAEVPPEQPWTWALLRDGRGLASQFASNKPDGPRQKVQRYLGALLQDFPANVSRSSATQTRALIVQQSADFWLRFDCYYESYPQCLLQTLSMSARERTHWWRNFFNKAQTRPCCLDPHFSLKLQRMGPVSAPLYRGSLLWNVFRSIEQDDSCTTTVEMSGSTGA